MKRDEKEEEEEEGGEGRKGKGRGRGEEKHETMARARTRTSEGKSCNEDSTSIESDKAVCAPAAFNEHSAPQPRPVHSTSTYVLVTPIPFRASPVIQNIDKGPRERERGWEGGREKGREKERGNKSIP